MGYIRLEKICKHVTSIPNDVVNFKVRIRDRNFLMYDIRNIFNYFRSGFDYPRFSLK